MKNLISNIWSFVRPISMKMKLPCTLVLPFISKWWCNSESTWSVFNTGLYQINLRWIHHKPNIWIIMECENSCQVTWSTNIYLKRTTKKITFFTYLFVYFDEMLNYEQLIDALCDKIWSNIVVTEKLEAAWTVPLFLPSTKAFLLPHINYCDVVYMRDSKRGELE